MDKGNKAIVDGTMERIIQDTIERLKPEAAYFYPEHGRRTANFVFDLRDASDIPSIAEPFFQQLGATCEFHPCMNADDLRTGIAKAKERTREPLGV